MKYVGNILYDEDILKRNKRFVICGVGFFGQKILQYLDMNGVKQNVICFCDSNIELNGQIIENIPVYYTRNVCCEYPDAEYVVGGRYSKEIYYMLRDNLIWKIHIVFI